MTEIEKNRERWDIYRRMESRDYLTMRRDSLNSTEGIGDRVSAYPLDYLSPSRSRSRSLARWRALLAVRDRSIVEIPMASLDIGDRKKEISPSVTVRSGALSKYFSSANRP